MKISIVGAGLSGLVLANKIKDKYVVNLFDKARGVGGRMATRYNGEFEFDHGAQFFTAKTKKFQDFINSLVAEGVVKPWQARFVEFRNNIVTDSRNWDESYPHYVGTPRMNSVPKHLARELDIKLQTKITSILKDQDKWLLIDENQQQVSSSDWLVTAMPLQQTIDILPKEFKNLEKLKSLRMKGCYALMLGFSEPLDISFDVAVIKDSILSWTSVNSSKPNRNNAFSLLVMSTNKWAEENMELDKEAVINIMTSELSKLLKQEIKPSYVDLQRWRYANADKNNDTEIFIDKENKIAICGDWCLHGRVEGAFLSADKVANFLLS